MSLSTAIMYHPRREALLGPLLERVGSALLVPDPNPDTVTANPWRTAQKAWLAGHDSFDEHGPGHHLVIQDDAWPCLNFIPAVERLVQLHPEACWMFFQLPPPTREPGIHVCTAYSGVATVLPRKWCEQFVEFGQWRTPIHRAHDDARMWEFCNRTEIPVLTVIPHLVQHGPPVKGTPRDRWNVKSPVYAGEDTDALTLIPEDGRTEV